MLKTPYLALLLLAPALACGTNTPPVKQATARDSAGIEIVDNGNLHVPIDSLPTVPIVDIGADQGDSAQRFTQLDGAIRGASGEIFVADAEESRIAAFDSTSRFLGQVGRPGGGPGEFRYLRSIWRYRGDSLLAWDAIAWRISMFDSHLQLGRSIQLAAALSILEVDGVFADGGVLVGYETVGAVPSSATSVHTTLVRHDARGQAVDSVPSLPTGRSIAKGMDGGRIFLFAPIFEARPQFAVTAGIVVVGMADEPEVRMETPHGVLRRLIRWGGGDRTVTPELVRAFVDARTRRIPNANMRKDLRRAYESLPVLPRLPAYDALLVGADGAIWVRAFRTPLDSVGPTRWRIFGPDGHLRGEEDVPKGFTLTDAGAGYVLGIWADPATGVQHVREYARE